MGRKSMMPAKKTYITPEKRIEAMSKEYLQLCRTAEITVLNDCFNWPDAQIEQFLQYMNVIVESMARGQDNYLQLKKTTQQLYGNASTQAFEVMRNVCSSTRGVRRMPNWQKVRAIFMPDAQEAICMQACSNMGVDPKATTWERVRAEK